MLLRALHGTPGQCNRSLRLATMLGLRERFLLRGLWSQAPEQAVELVLSLAPDHPKTAHLRETLARAEQGNFEAEESLRVEWGLYWTSEE